MLLTRRRLLHSLRDGAIAAGAFGSSLAIPRASWAAGAPVTPGLPAGAAESAVLDALPGKQPLIKLSYRPPNYETPLAYFDQLLTANDAFFVRYHLANIPEIDVASWKLSIAGDASTAAAQYSLEELKSGFEHAEIVAVNQCSGNRRGLSSPHVQGVQWGYGAMGNARWTGVRLKDVLEKSGVKKEALEVAFNGADSGVTEQTPDFIKSIPIWRALDETTLLAWDMNGAPLPRWNGFPLRLVVPGWTGTYWMKHLVGVEVRSAPLGGFWMNPAYRVPLGKFATIDRFTSQDTDQNTPITEIVVNSLITSPASGVQIAAGQAVEIKGIAWDGGRGIQSVDVSNDGGQSWRAAALGEDLGQFSFRPWRFSVTPAAGPLEVTARATNALGYSQPAKPVFNLAGYHHNAMHKISLTGA